MSIRTPKPLLSLMLVGLLSACGGGSTSTPTPGDPNFQCPEGPGFECSGDKLGVDNGIALTESGVYAYGVSTNDLQTPIVNSGSAHGLALPASDELAKAQVEVRLAKSGTGAVTNTILFLDKLGISWDAVTERPPIIETFLADQQGRIVHNSDGSVSIQPLPLSSNLDFYDFGKVVNGVPVSWDATQNNYANNVYFPRNERSRCVGTMECLDYETKGVKLKELGDWRSTGGLKPDLSEAKRLHSDGDLHAGDADPAFPGAVDLFPGAVDLFPGRYSLPMGGGNSSNPDPGLGTPYPGFKGYRNFVNRSFQHVNLSAWETQDTVEIVEYSGGPDDCKRQVGECVEHNKMRRGMVAFGDVTQAMPTSGTATYIGRAYGAYVNGLSLDSKNLAHLENSASKNDVYSYQGDLRITVNYATGEARVEISRSEIWEGGVPDLPFSNLNATLNRGSNLANYATGGFTRASDSTSGGMSVRYFGQNAAEMGGTFTMTNAAGETAVGGFIARKQ